MLQLSHSEPAIKHGVLALSTMHERFESTSLKPNARDTDFAFVQYMQAVKHSKNLLAAHREGNVHLEMVLIACIIFTCYENLVGNYKAANMHLQNGLRILNQHKTSSSAQMTASEESVDDVLHRFDLQAMTFSENASPYDYAFDRPPVCPQIPKTYTNNSAARNSLVGILRCVMWIWGVADEDPSVSEHPNWVHFRSQVSKSLEKWENTFARYQQNMPPYEQGGSRIYAGNTLLKVYAVMSRIILGGRAGVRTELAWDGFVDSFKTLVDLAETLPVFQPYSPPSSRSSSSPSPGHSQAARNIPIAPNPDTAASFTPSVASTMVFRLDNVPKVDVTQVERERNVGSMSKQALQSFSPSFELSLIVPMFLTACRCRDPIIRRRAIALLLNSRRREGIWDSLGAGLVAVEWLKKEEGINLGELPADNWVPLTPSCQDSKHIPEWRRVKDVHIAVDLVQGRIDLTYAKVDGSECQERRELNEAGFLIPGVDGTRSARTGAPR